MGTRRCRVPDSEGKVRHQECYRRDASGTAEREHCYILYDANGTDFINFEESHVVKSFLFGESLERLDTVSDHYPVILDINLK